MIKLAIFHYASFLKGAYATIPVEPSTKFADIIGPWKKYFKNPNLRVFKFKKGSWAIPHTNTDNTFDESTTIQQYIDFYGGPNMDGMVGIIFV